MWRCGACGYVWDGEEPPGRCPNCGAVKEKYAELQDKAMELVERSRFTNGLHMSLYTLLEQVMDVAEDGIDDNLDPGCVKIFKRAMAEAEILQQSIKAELQGHMNKGKWG
jgi:predicted  nucleic acid-binding Zn-ribbon protein